MPYKYEDEKAEIFTEAYQETFLGIRDRVRKLIEESGAVTWSKAHSGFSGSSWTLMACVDRLVELGEIRRINQAEAVNGQDEIFVSAK